MKDKIISFFESIKPESYHVEDAAYLLQIKGAEALNQFMELIYELKEEGILVTKDQVFYRFSNGPKEIEGIYKGYRKTYGFVITPEGMDDIYVAVENKNSAMHNDKVRVRLLHGDSYMHKQEGIITRVIERANQTVVGTYDRLQKFGFVTPVDERLGDDIYVDLENTMNARSGAKVMVEIIKWPVDGKKAEGKIIEILGYEGDTGLDINLIMAKHKIPFKFPNSVMDESKHINLTISENSKRWDLRNLPIITIDGEDAKDLDDGVSFQQLDNGNYELGVHIADVSHYVRAGSEIDKEAYKRGTSVYLVDRVVPMLPEVLSNGICSLNAGEDRNAMTCMMEIDGKGKVVSYKIKPSIIRVGRRCSYREIYKALIEDIIPDDLMPFMDMVRGLYTVSTTLTAMRRRRGALDFDFPEYRVMLDADGVPLKIVKRERTIAERLIEECMLIANETVATHLKNTHRASVYRIHERPNAEKLGNFQTVVNYLGNTVTFDADSVEPRDIQEFLETVKGTDIEQIAQIMTLRSMQQAKYSINNVGHFGLASSCYTHFTSPIRRYPDLMVHRLLKADLHWEDGHAPRDVKEEFLNRAAEHSSIQEQVAVEAERDTDDLKKTQYMVPFVGEVFDGKVNSITSFGMFVELENGIDGLVHINMMNDDYYFYDEEHFLLVGKHTGKTYHLGQKVQVTLVKADVEKQQIDFVLGEVNNLAAIQEQMANNMFSKGRRDGKSGKATKKRSNRNQLGNDGVEQPRSNRTAKKGKKAKKGKHTKQGAKKAKKGRRQDSHNAEIMIYVGL